MLNLDGFEKAWNVLEWNFSFSIGDGVTLVIAAVTTVLAFLTYRIQKEQKKIVEQQNNIIERQVAIDELKFKRDNHLYKKTLINAIVLTTKAFVDGADPDSEIFNYLKQNQDFMGETFDKEVGKFVFLLMFYAENEKEWKASLEGRKKRDEFQAKIRNKFIVIIENLLAHSHY
ncbi:hypothetical protein D0S45_17575 [Marinifilum sp. JC120]|nr:hypothetical protein D0S45_17575 [Marinifilum sp. JC120]